MHITSHTSYTLEGLQGSPVLVLANSLAASSEMWDAQIPAWRKQFQVLRYDYYGHGDTAPCGTSGSVEQLADDLLSLLNGLAIQRFSFVGVSLGGMLGIHLAGTVPHRVERLAAANFSYFQTDLTRQQWDQRMALVRENGVESIVKGTADRWLTEDFRKDHPERDARLRAMIRATSVDGYLACAQAVRDYDSRPLLNAISSPVLLISGSEDLAAPAEKIAGLGQFLKKSAYVELPAAHLSNIECSEQFTQLILSFIGRAPD